MLIHERELLLLGLVAADQLPQRPQAVSAMRLGDLAGAFDLIDVIAFGQREQALQDPHAFDAAAGDHAFGPAGGLRADQANLT